VLQEKTKVDNLGSRVSLTHYEPGWAAQHQLTRPQFKNLLKTQPETVCIHLDAARKHFSAIVLDIASSPLGERDASHASVKRKVVTLE
jgi:hypothetical protein